MYKDKQKQKEAVRDAVRRHRVLHKGITHYGITGEKQTGGVTYPVILYALTDLVKRVKLEKD